MSWISRSLAGARPAGDNGSYFQKVPLVGVETAPGAQFSLAAAGKTIPKIFGEEGEAVFRALIGRDA